ncbi:MAG: hypothetical protein R3C97_15130 [Geminicoccaceae bacterium]
MSAPDRTLLEIRVVRGYLSEGDTITVRFGDRREGLPRHAPADLCEDTFEFRVLVDPIATFVFQPLPQQPTIRIVPGPPDRWRLVPPTLRRVGERFRLSIKADDIWGNPSDQVDTDLVLEPSLPVLGLPETVRFAQGKRSLVLDLLQCDHPGDLVIDAHDDTGHLARSNPLRIDPVAENPTFWGDLHGQSEETIGTNSARDYFLFGRNLAFLDACAHQGNDFQITNHFWNDLNKITAELNEPGRFITVPGFEWSGNTALGGGPQCLLLPRGSADPAFLACHAPRQFRYRQRHEKPPESCSRLWRKRVKRRFVPAHCGGRYADGPSPSRRVLRAFGEVHSAWGTFEWLLHDAFDMGYRVGTSATATATRAARVRPMRRCGAFGPLAD